MKTIRARWCATNSSTTSSSNQHQATYLNSQNYANDQQMMTEYGTGVNMGDNSRNTPSDHRQQMPINVQYRKYSIKIKIIESKIRVDQNLNFCEVFHAHFRFILEILYKANQNNFKRKYNNY
jgi:hypothetical protein